MKFKEMLINFSRKAWYYIKLAKIELIVLLAAVILDQITKVIMANAIPLGDSVELIPNFLYFTYVQNTKAAFGSAFGLEKLLGDEGIRIFFIIITTIAMAVFAYILYRFRHKHIVVRLALALILAGALGNYIDRIFLKYVRDFVEIVYFGCKMPITGSTSFAIFNVADAALTVGVVMFIVYYLFIYKDPAKPVTADGKLPEGGAVVANGENLEKTEDSAGDNILKDTQTNMDADTPQDSHTASGAENLEKTEDSAGDNILKDTQTNMDADTPQDSHTASGAENIEKTEDISEVKAVAGVDNTQKKDEKDINE